MSNEDKDDFIDENANLVDDREEAEVGMDEINNFDFDRAMQLMSVIKEIANTSPQNSAIAGLAGQALSALNEEAKAVGRRRSEELDRLMAKAREKAQAEQDAEAEKARRAAEAQDEEARAPAASPRPALQRQTGGTPNPPEKPDPTPGQPVHMRQRVTPADAESPAPAPRRPV